MVLDVLPHEFLAKIAAGHPIKIKNVIFKGDDFGDVIEKIEKEEDFYPSVEQRIDCAKAAAPYFAIKLGSAQNDSVDTAHAIAGLLKELGTTLP